MPGKSIGDWAVPVWHMPFQSDPSPAGIQILHDTQLLRVLRHVSSLHSLWRNSSTSGAKTHWHSCRVACSVPHSCGQPRYIAPHHSSPHCTPDHCWPHLRRTDDQARAWVSMATCGTVSKHAHRQSLLHCRIHALRKPKAVLTDIKSPQEAAE